MGKITIQKETTIDPISLIGREAEIGRASCRERV